MKDPIFKTDGDVEIAIPHENKKGDNRCDPHYIPLHLCPAEVGHVFSKVRSACRGAGC